MPKRAQTPTTNGYHQGLWAGRDPIVANQINQLIENISSGSRGFLQRIQDPRRDIDDECGFPKQPGPQEYWDLYDRDPVAARVVEVLPRESWRVQPQVYETEDSKDATEFERAWDDLGKRLRGEESWFGDEAGSPVWEYLQRIDELCGVGQYGVILLGLDDGLDLREPAKKSENQLTFIRVFPEILAQITRYEADPKSRRFGQPAEYLLTFNDPREQHSGVGLTTSTMNVHWSRCIHVADNLRSSEIFGTERMRPVLNNLLGLRKLYGAGPEGYWKSAFTGISFETHPQLGGDVNVNKGALRDMWEQYQNGLQKALFLMGMSAKPLAPTVVDPTPQVATQIEAICIKLAVPVPVFKGYEIGEQASSENQLLWDARLRQRQQNFITPRIIVPFVDRLISLGCLPEPRGYSISWPDMAAASDQQKAQVLSVRTQAYAAYVSGQVESVIPPLDFMTKFDGMDEEEAQAILDEAAKAAEDRAEMAPMPPPGQEQQGPQAQPPGEETAQPAPEAAAKPAAPTDEEFDQAVGNANLVTNQRALIDEIIWNCGGPGSGVPGPCPTRFFGKIADVVKATKAKVDQLTNKVPGVKFVKDKVEAATTKLNGFLENRYGKVAAAVIMKSALYGPVSLAGMASGLKMPGVPGFNDVIGVAVSVGVAESALQIGRGARFLGRKLTGNEEFLVANMTDQEIESVAKQVRKALLKTIAALIEEHGEEIGRSLKDADLGDDAKELVGELDVEDEATDNEFCATGMGGGVDPSCSPGASTEAVRGEDKVWRDKKGNQLPEHIQKIGIPPGWKDVRVDLNPTAMLVARGTDAKGRGQSKYSAAHSAMTATAKFGRVSELRKKREDIFKEIDKDARNPELKDRAECLKVVMQTGMRPGSDHDTLANHKSYGATTLEGRHVVETVKGVVLRLVTGKNKGREVDFPIADKNTAAMLQQRAREVGPNGRVFKTSAEDLRQYSKVKDGGGFKTKDHRTALGTETAVHAIQELKPPTTVKERKAAVKEVATRVARTLGNTPSVALKSYIDPSVFAAWSKK